MFGGAPRRQQGRPGRDLQYDVVLTLEQVVKKLEAFDFSELEG